MLSEKKVQGIVAYNIRSPQTIIGSYGPNIATKKTSLVLAITDVVLSMWLSTHSLDRDAALMTGTSVIFAATNQKLFILYAAWIAL
jgi:hypothetical protein